MRPVMIDPGHGGALPCGRSTPAGVTGPHGLAEKAVTLGLGQALARALARAGIPALLTRDHDHNPSLGHRAFLARSEDARALVSLHLDGGPPGASAPCVWVHERAAAASGRLARAIQVALGRLSRRVVGLERGPLALLHPDFLPPDAAACLVEVEVLADPEVEAALRSPARLEALAEVLAGAIAEGLGLPQEPERTLTVRGAAEHVDIWHEVPLVYQLTGMSCWAAAAAMLVGWRDCVDVDPEEVAHASGRWEAYRDGLVPEDVQALAAAWGLVLEPPRAHTVHSLQELLERSGPLWVGEASPGLHVVVITGLCGDGSPGGTRVHINDPWPVGQGERYGITFAELARNLEDAAGLSGVPAQVLHTGGRGGSRSVEHRRAEMTVSVGVDGRGPAMAVRAGSARWSMPRRPR